MAFEKITAEDLLCLGYTVRLIFFSLSVGTLCLIFSVIFCLLIIGKGKLNFETSTCFVLGFCLFGFFVLFCFFGGSERFDFHVWLPKKVIHFFQCLFKWKI